MERLGLEYLDLYLIHWLQPKQGKYVETWSALIELQKSGRVRSIGVCNFTIEALSELEEATGVLPVINQVETHPYFPQTELREFAASRASRTSRGPRWARAVSCWATRCWPPSPKSTGQPRHRSSSPGTWRSATWSSPSRLRRRASSRTSKALPSLGRRGHRGDQRVGQGQRRPHRRRPGRQRLRLNSGFLPPKPGEKAPCRGDPFKWGPHGNLKPMRVGASQGLTRAARCGHRRTKDCRPNHRGPHAMRRPSGQFLEMEAQLLCEAYHSKLPA